ncbi:MAG: hypothetical protein Q9168_007370 [Polycauliona sp. 1 TL-2023]
MVRLYAHQRRFIKYNGVDEVNDTAGKDEYVARVTLKWLLLRTFKKGNPPPVIHRLHKLMVSQISDDGPACYSSTLTASLVFPLASENFSKTLSALKQSTLSVTNRLSSIHHDSLFVQQVADLYQLPLVANERCGSWYIPPGRKAGSAYFKSTDGHQGEWSFSTRRLNLQVLDLLGQRGGARCIIVDSTRRGKSMPDALSKTIPIWCAVMNRLLFSDQNQDIGLITPATVVGSSEHSQIESRLDAFVSNAMRLQLDTCTLRQTLSGPLRPFFVTPDHPFPDLPSQTPSPYHPIICLTSSHRIHGTENSEKNYIQGAGDDSESWSHGLTPTLFWSHKETLMSTTEAELPSLIASLIAQEQTNVQKQPTLATLIAPTRSIYVGSHGSIDSDTWDAVVCCSPTDPFEGRSSTRKTPRILHLPTPQGKLGSRALRTHLHLLDPFLHPLFAVNTTEAPAKGLRILFTCPTGTDLAVGTALVALCLFFNDAGNEEVGKGSNDSSGGGMIDKLLIRRRLAWIMTVKTDARPTRETLQAVNSCLISR